MDRLWLRIAAPAAAMIALAGCGGSSPHRATGDRTTVPAYGTFPPDTISVSSTNPTSPACHLQATAFARTSRLFVTRSPADTYYMMMREELADFGARGCSPALLGRALERGLTPAQRRSLVADLPRRMVRVVLESLSAGGS